MVPVPKTMFFLQFQAQNLLCYFPCHFPLSLLLREAPLLLSGPWRPAALLWLPTLTTISRWLLPFSSAPWFPWLIPLSRTSISQPRATPPQQVAEQEASWLSPVVIGPERNNVYMYQVKNGFWTWKPNPFPFDFVFYLQTHWYASPNLQPLQMKNNPHIKKHQLCVRQLFHRLAGSVTNREP